MGQLTSTLEDLGSDIGRLEGVWRPLGEVLAVLEESLSVLEASGSLLWTCLAALEAS